MIELPMLKTPVLPVDLGPVEAGPVRPVSSARHGTIIEIPAPLLPFSVILEIPS
jgi:hypothetical protein